MEGWKDKGFLPPIGYIVFFIGKIMYVINDAHLHGVTALALTSDSQRVVSGGSEGEVRVFRLGKQS